MPGGRGKKFPVDYVKVETLASCGCTDVEIAAVLGCSSKTVERLKKFEEFQKAIETGYAKGRMSLRSKLYRLAMDGNVAACIFLSKQRVGVGIGLGYSDRTESEISGPNGRGIPLTLNIFDVITETDKTAG